MTLPASGAISFNNINVELGVSGTTQASLGQASYRALAGVASGAISMSNFYGKSNQFAFTISTNQTNANLRTLAVNAGWNGTSQVAATINGGVYISSNSTGTPALTVNGSFPNGVQLVNNGFIIGMGGAGGAGSGNNTNTPAQTAGSAGSGGGLALLVSSAVSITNNGTIGGGGGGGGGGQASANQQIVGKYGYYYWSGGGGGGGGRTGTAANSSAGGGGTNTPGGIQNLAGNAGSVGTSAGGGSGGAGRSTDFATSGAGGAGGNWGSSGNSGGAASPAVNFSMPTAGPYGGGAAGGAVSGNSNITWVTTGTRLGSIS